MPGNNAAMERQSGKRTETICPLCGSPGIEPRYEIERCGSEFSVHACSECRFMFRNPVPTLREIRKWYGEGYYTGAAEYSYCDERRIEPFARFVWDKRIQLLRKQTGGGNLLDVGCSFGGFMKAASACFIPHGIEISGYAGRYAKGIFREAVHIGTLEDHPFPPSYFSAITMIEVIEHLPDPLSSLAECYKLLRPGGVLLVQTANMDGLQARIQGPRYAYFMPGHCSYFSRRNLLMALTKCGFRKVKFFHPVEFGLIPKLRKSRGGFKSWSDYRHWIRIAAYHAVSKIHIGDFAATSSLSLYAFK